MHLMLFDAFLAACIATITAETLSDDSLLLNNPSLFYEELPEDLSRNDPETFVFSDQYDASGGDLFPPQDISSLTTDLASLTPDAPLCLPNEGDQPPMRKRRGRRDEGSSGSSCDAISNKPRNPPGRPLKKFDEKIWREFMGSPGDVEPEDLSTVFPILKVPKDDNQNCVPEFPKHLCCAQLGLLESNMDSLRMVFDRMYRCDIAIDNTFCRVPYDVCCEDYYADARFPSTSFPVVNFRLVGSRCYQLGLSLNAKPNVGL